jgi:hypothetical protein
MIELGTIEARMPVATDHPTARRVIRVRRAVNETTYDMAIRHEVDADLPLEFMCECGRADCTEQIELLLRQFDRSAPAGSISAHSTP